MEFCQNILTKVAMINPISAMRQMFPMRVRSDLVTYPYRAITPNVPAATKNVEAIELMV